jgi:protein-S-isoprenylcysteine O-methyltransferase Ste14
VFIVYPVFLYPLGSGELPLNPHKPKSEFIKTRTADSFADLTQRGYTYLALIGKANSMTPYQRVFGAGPLLLALSIGLMAGAIYLQNLTNLPRPTLSWPLRLVLAIGMLAAVLVMGLWSVQALPLTERGKRLVASGPYRYVRHPLYSSLLLLGLANFFVAETYFILVALILLYVIAHAVVRYEEGLMERQFGQEWRAYAKRTPRFFPRLWRSGGVMDVGSDL